GGRVTGLAALESYGLRVPRRAVTDIAVPRNSCRLRRPDDRRERLYGAEGRHPQLSLAGSLRIHWVDEHQVTPADGVDPFGGTAWRVSPDDALLVILRTEPRHIAIACCSAVMRYLAFSW